MINDKIEELAQKVSDGSDPLTTTVNLTPE